MQHMRGARLERQGLVSVEELRTWIDGMTVVRHLGGNFRAAAVMSKCCHVRAGSAGCAQQGAVGGVPGGGAALHGLGPGHAGGGARAPAAGPHVRHGRFYAAPRAGPRRRSRR